MGEGSDADHDASLLAYDLICQHHAFDECTASQHANFILGTSISSHIRVLVCQQKTCTLFVSLKWPLRIESLCIRTTHYRLHYEKD